MAESDVLKELRRIGVVLPKTFRLLRVLLVLLAMLCFLPPAIMCSSSSSSSSGYSRNLLLLEFGPTRSYEFPASPAGMKHGLCAFGENVRASSDDPDLTYEQELDAPFGDGVKLWGDTDYVGKGIQGPSLCEGGTYLRPSKYEVDLGTKIEIEASAMQGRGCVSICILLHGESGDWGEGWGSLVSGKSGFSKSNDTISWAAFDGSNLTSYCKEIGSCSDRYEIQTGFSKCPEGRNICANECHHAIMDSWVDPDDVLSSKVVEKDTFAYSSPCGCFLHGGELGSKTLLTNFDASTSDCEINSISRPVCLRDNQHNHNCSLPYVSGMYGSTQQQSDTENGGESSSSSRGSALFVGLVILVQSMAFTNYVYVKSLRRRVDEELPSKIIFTDEQIAKATDAFNDTMLYFFNPKKLSKERRKAEETRLREKRMLWIATIAQGLFLSQIRKEPTQEKDFVNWRPIPRKKGLITTALLLILSSIVLSPTLLGSEARDMLVPDLCVSKESEPLMDKLDEDLDKEMNLHVAREQAQFYSDLANNLRDDTSLYGTGDFKCDNIVDNDGIGERLVSGDKSVWNKDPNSYPKSKYGEFFPGYCAAARVKALENARSATCPKRICVTSFAGKVYGFFTGGGNCRTIYVACPKHTADQEEETQDYQNAQYQRAQEMQDAVDTFVERAENKAEEIVSNAGKVVNKLLTQIEVASGAFAAYKAISVFFPAPLEMFRPTFGTMIKNNVFGAGSTAFTALLVAVWWGIEYFDQFSRNFRLYANMDYLKSPCFADRDFMEERSNMIYEKCNDLLTLSNEIALNNVTIQHIAIEVLAFQKECNCKFPYHHTENTAIPYSVAQYGWQAIDICVGDCEDTRNDIPAVPRWMDSINGESINDMVDKGGVISPGSFELQIPIPGDNVTFLGNDTICFDPEYTRKQFMLPPESNARFWDVWMKTGLLAMFLIRLFIAVLGFWLLRLADPFSCCDGKYISPPERYTLAEHEQPMQDLKDNTKSALTFIAFKQVLIYAFVTNLALLNLIIVLSGDKNREMSRDIVLFMIALGVAIMVPLVALVLYHRNFIRNGGIGQLCTRMKENLMFWKKKPSPKTPFEYLIPSMKSDPKEKAKTPLKSKEGQGYFTSKVSKKEDQGLLERWGIQPSSIDSKDAKKQESKPKDHNEGLSLFSKNQPNQNKEEDTLLDRLGIQSSSTDTKKKGRKGVDGNIGMGLFSKNETKKEDDTFLEQLGIQSPPEKAKKKGQSQKPNSGTTAPKNKIPSKSDQDSGSNIGATCGIDSIW